MSSLHNQYNAFKMRNMAQPEVLRTALHRLGPSAAPPALVTATTAPPPASAPEPARRSLHAVNIDLHRAIRFLKDVNRNQAVSLPQTIASIHAATGLRLDPDSDPQLWERLTQNTKIQYDAASQTFLYKPDIAVNTKEELLALLHARLLEGSGLDLTQRDVDSNLDIRAAIRELEAEKQVLVLRTSDKRQERMVFYNEMRYNTPVDDEFVQQWHRLKLPDVAEMAKQLEAKGHTVSREKEIEKKKDVKVAKKRAGGGARKMKLTNAHMLDLFKEDWKTG